MSAIITLLTAAALNGAVTEEFNSLDELKQNWWISSWGHVPKQYSADNVAVEDGILRLTMIPDSLDGAPRPLCGEVTYTGKKFLYGSFRASIKTTERSGGVVGWFVYKDGVPGDGNLHEIDMEILTEDITQIHYTLHHDAYSVDHAVDPLGFDPSADFHEYRFDWYPDSVVYYIDGERRMKQTVTIPDDSCSVMLNYWSNNNVNWGGDMPDTVTHMWVDYMHYVPLTFEETPVAEVSPIKKMTSRISATSRELTVIPSMEQPVNLSIYSLKGQLLFQKEIFGRTRLNHRLSEGAYIVRLRGTAGVEVQKITVI